jgi:hypothetical protein
MFVGCDLPHLVTQSVPGTPSDPLVYQFQETSVKIEFGRLAAAAGLVNRGIRDANWLGIPASYTSRNRKAILMRPSTTLDMGSLKASKPETTPSDQAVEQPILWLGVTGFSPQQRAALDASLGRPAGLPQWRTCAFGEADAWLVNGAKVSLLPGGNLKVAAGLPTEHALNLNLADVDRPVAFATPLPSPKFEPRCTFNCESPASVQAALLQFENWLRVLRSQFVLGARILQQSTALRRGIFHVSRGGLLLAVLDFKAGRAGLLPGAHPVDLWEARWDKRPPGASESPPAFLRFTPAQFAWAYVRRTDRDLLPPRYEIDVIYFRHAPKVPLRWLSDSQLMLLRELSAEPATLETLHRHTSFPLPQIRRDLTCLYYAGSITTTRAKAPAPLGRQDSQPYSRGPQLDSLLNGVQSVDHPSDFTAPVLLERKQTHPAGDRPKRS